MESVCERRVDKILSLLLFLAPAWRPSATSQLPKPVEQPLQIITLTSIRWVSRTRAPWHHRPNGRLPLPVPRTPSGRTITHTTESGTIHDGKERLRSYSLHLPSGDLALVCCGRQSLGLWGWRKSRWSSEFRFVEETLPGSLWRVLMRTVLLGIPMVCCLETWYSRYVHYLSHLN